jgi:hypothetical protein
VEAGPTLVYLHLHLTISKKSNQLYRRCVNQ